MESAAHGTERAGSGTAGAETGSGRAEGAPEVRWPEHLARACEAFASEMRDCVPREFARHARGSVREALLAVRSLIDAGIEKIDRESKDAEPRKVPVE